MGGLISRTGTSRDGVPLSLTRTPPATLADYVARFFVTIIERPEDAVLEDFLLHDAAYIRVPVFGQWEALIDGTWTRYEGPMLFGAQRRRFPVRCIGPIIAAGFAIRQGGWCAFSDRPAHEMVDRVVPIDGAWGQALRWACANILDHEETFARMQNVVRDRLIIHPVRPEADAAAFELIARVDPTRPVAEIAGKLGMSGRRLDRMVRQYFGHQPKTVMRRSRFLDMAAVMRGLAVPTTDELAELRFYDASHLNREFREFVGMTPAQFRRTPTTLFTPSLELRQQRKRVDMAPHLAAPWRDDPLGDAAASTPAAARPGGTRDAD